MISIVIPVYNAENYLARCIESILSQQYGDIELILVDDGSIDKSKAICQAFAERDPRIKVICQENRGVSAARNKGLDAVSGEWVLFVDADDYWEPTTLERIVPAVAGYDLLIFNYYKVTDTGKERCDPVPDCEWNKEEFLRDWERNLTAVYYNKIYNKVYKQSILQKYKIRFPCDVTIGEDLAFNVRYFSHCETIKCLPEYLYHYRIDNQHSLMHLENNRRLETSLFCIAQIENFFRMNAPDFSELKKGLDFYILDTFTVLIHGYAQKADKKESLRLISAALSAFTARYPVSHFEKFPYPRLLQYAWNHRSGKCVYLRWKIIQVRYRAILFLRGKT